MKIEERRVAIASYPDIVADRFGAYGIPDVRVVVRIPSETARTRAAGRAADGRETLSARGIRSTGYSRNR